MNNTDLETSLRTEIENHFKNTIAEMRQDVVQLQDQVNNEIERLRAGFENTIQGLLTREMPQLDPDFTRLVAEHLRIAREDGSNEAIETLSAQMTDAQQPAGVDPTLVRAAIDDISSQTSQADILKTLVRHAGTFAPRGAFFVVKSDHLIGWRAFGEEANISETAIREIILPLSGDSMLGASIKQNQTQFAPDGVRADDTNLLNRLGFENAADMVAVPLVVRGRGVAVLYADSGASGAPVYSEAIESIVTVASLTVDLLAAGRTPQAATARQAKPESAKPVVAPSVAANRFQLPTRPAATSVESVEPTYAAEPVAQTEANAYEVEAVEATPDYEYASTPGPVAATVESFDAPSTQTFGMPEQPAYSVESYTSTETNGAGSSSDVAGFDYGATAGSAAYNYDTAVEPAVQASVPETSNYAPAADFAPPPPDFNFSTPTSASAPVETAPTVAAAPPVAEPTVSRRFGERNVDLPIEVPDDERRLHNDARRFARLLVSEIKLYNEQKVKEGRQAGDLYERLREAVDRSREMYDKRVSPPVAARFDYFHHELVGTLAEGSEAKLGASYPGALVKA